MQTDDDTTGLAPFCLQLPEHVTLQYGVTGTNYCTVWSHWYMALYSMESPVPGYCTIMVAAHSWPCFFLTEMYHSYLYIPPLFMRRFSNLSALVDYLGVLRISITQNGNLVETLGHRNQHHQPKGISGRLHCKYGSQLPRCIGHQVHSSSTS